MSNWKDPIHTMSWPAHPAQWMIWEAEPQAAVVTQLESLGIKSLVFRPAGKRPATGDFLSVMQHNVKNLR